MNVSFISLGCDKNRVNTEQMMALCLQAGITVQEDCPGSDVVVINTCGFIDSAKSEAIDTILSAAQLKDAGEIQKILVTGCLSQRYQADILDELPEIDGIMGTGCFGDIVPALEQVMNGQECRHFADINGPVEELPRVLSTPRQYAYLRIAEGCSNRCAYCVIPSLRGNYRSRRMEDILQEAQALADDGVQECIVIAQDITRYGMDLYGERKLPELLRALCRLPFHWIRLHYLYPDDITDELIDKINEAGGTAQATSVKDMWGYVEDKVSSINAMKYTLMIFAVLLSVVVLYNLSLLNINERTRDIATLKVLGFKRGKIALSLLFEIMLLTLAGTVCGLILGYPLTYLVLSINKVEIMSFLYYLKPVSYVYSALLALLTSFAINYIFGRSLDKINMIESLKSVE